MIIRSMRAWIHLIWLTAKRQLFTKKNFVAISLLALLCGLMVLISLRRDLSVEFFGRRVVTGPFGSFIFPMILLAFGTASLGNERDDGTLVYLATRPLWRWSIYLGKYLGIVPIGLLFSVGGLWVICKITSVMNQSPEIMKLFEMVYLGFILGALAYLALFHLIAAVFKHAILISLAYLFSIEIFVGRVPGIAKCISISYYTSTVVYNQGNEFGIVPPDPLVHLPMSTETAFWTLASMTAGLLIMGATIFRLKDYTRN